MDRLIFHIDVNSVFLSWEATRRVSMGEDDIRLIPSAIGGDREKRTGDILAKSIPAKKFGRLTEYHRPVIIPIAKPVGTLSKFAFTPFNFRSPCGSMTTYLTTIGTKIFLMVILKVNNRVWLSW